MIFLKKKRKIGDECRSMVKIEFFGKKDTLELVIGICVEIFKILSDEIGNLS